MDTKKVLIVVVGIIVLLLLLGNTGDSAIASQNASVMELTVLATPIVGQTATSAPQMEKIVVVVPNDVLNQLAASPYIYGLAGGAGGSGGAAAGSGGGFAGGTDIRVAAYH